MSPNSTPASGSAALEAASTRAAAKRTFWITAAATFIGFLDVTIVNVAIPSIAESFERLPLSSLSWVINGYAITFAALLVPSGRLADRVGRKALFLSGLALFTVASLLAALAPTIEILIAARIVQGAAAAAMLPAALALLLAEFPPEQWTRAVAMWGAIASLASGLGPLLGGVLVTAESWRLIFLVNIPVGILTVAFGYRMLRESRDRAGTKRPDLLGALLLAASVGLLALGLVRSDVWGWGSAEVLGSFGASAVFAVALGFRLATHEAPIFETALFRQRMFTVATGSTFLFGVAFYSLLLCSILFLTQVWGYSTLRAGLAIFPGPLMSAVAAPVGGRLAERYGHRAVIVGGSVLFAVAMVWLASALGTESNFVGAWLPGYALAGVAIGLIYPSQTTAAASGVPATRFGTGIALTITARQIGASLGVAVLVSVLGTQALSGGAPVSIDHFRDGLLMCALAGALVGVVSLWLPRSPSVKEAQSTAAVQPASASAATALSESRQA